MYDLTSPKQTSELMRSHGVRPQKRLGQNFLCDRNILNRIVQAAHLDSETPVLEIGAGAGALTLALAQSAKQVTAVEIDYNLEPLLREVTAPFTNIDLVFSDFMRVSFPELCTKAFGESRGAVVANIPYYITTPIIEKLLEDKHLWSRAVLLVQQEVAQRLLAKPDTREYGSMTLFVQYHAKVEFICKVPPTVFLPQPEVTSSVIALEPILPGAISVRNPERLNRLVRAAFGQRRKTLLNSLLRAPASFQLGFGMDDRKEAEALLERAGIDGNRRGETLSLEEFGQIENAYEDE